jgi:hypothetical protein
MNTPFALNPAREGKKNNDPLKGYGGEIASSLGSSQ